MRRPRLNASRISVCVLLGSLTLVNTSVIAQKAAEARVSDNPVYSQSTALRWSLLGTLAPFAAGLGVAATGPTDGGAVLTAMLLGGGAIVGPSLGHFYARQNQYALIMTAARMVVGLGFGALAVAACPEFEGCTSGEETRMATFFVVGSSLVGVSAIIDIVRAPSSARRSNRRGADLSFGPRVSLDRSIGVSARLSF